MPIKLHELTENEATCQAEFMGETASVTYRPAAYTPELEEEIRECTNEDLPSNSLAVLLSEVLISWEVLDENGDKIPPEYENLRKMPTRFLAAVVRAINEDQNPEEEDRKNSGGRSQRRAKSAKRRRGSLS